MKASFSVSDIKISLNENPCGGIIGFCSMVINDSIKLCNIALKRDSDNSLKLCYPNKIKGDKSFWNFYPISVEANAKLISEVENKLRGAIGDVNS